MAYKTPTRPGTFKRYKAIQDEYRRMTKEQHLQPQYVREQLMLKYYIDHDVTLLRILNTELPAEAPKKVVNPNQLDIYGNLEGGEVSAAATALVMPVPESPQAQAQ